MVWFFKKKEEKDEGSEFGLVSPESLEKAVLFNSFDERDQRSIIWIYDEKLKNGELEKAGVVGIEEAAKLYQAQQCAFEDVLYKEGFQSSQKVERGYSGRIAFLTRHGTLTVLGKDKEKGRHITMERIHNLDWSWNHRRGHIIGSLTVGYGPKIAIVGGTFYSGSNIRLLAVNHRGADGDELEAAQNIIFGIGMSTMELLLKPREKVKVGEENECGYLGKF